MPFWERISAITIKKKIEQPSVITPQHTLKLSAVQLSIRTKLCLCMFCIAMHCDWSAKCAFFSTKEENNQRSRTTTNHVLFALISDWFVVLFVLALN